MDARTRLTVRERAGEACEYCQRRQADSPLIPLQIEHITPRKHGALGDHFAWDGLRIIGRTPIGRTTVRVLDLNAPARVRVRRVSLTK
jgi:hypothetical protein